MRKLTAKAMIGVLCVTLAVTPGFGAALAQNAALGNLLRNAGFETDANGDKRPDGWSNPSFRRSSGRVFSGDFAGTLSANDATHVVQQKVSGLEAGETYVFEGHVYIPPSTDLDSFRIFVRWLNRANRVISTETLRVFAHSKGSWRLLSRALVAPNRATSAVIRMRVVDLEGRIYVDDFAFKEAVGEFDGTVGIQPDHAAAQSAPIGADGGTIEVEGMTLEIPPGAVPAGTTITVTPLRGLVGSPFAGQILGVHLEPSGLVLLQPATLSLPVPVGASPGQIVTFVYEGDGEDLHLVPHVLTGGLAEILVWHFSGAGLTIPTRQELETILRYETGRAHGRAEQRIAAALDAFANGGPDPGQAILDALVDWHNSSVLPGLEIAATDQLAIFELALAEWAAWRAIVQMYGDSLQAPQQQLLSDIETNVQTPLAIDAGAAQADRLLGRCTGVGDLLPPVQGIIRLAADIIVLDLPIEMRATNDGRTLPSGDELVKACMDVELTSLTHAPTFARNRENRLAAGAQVVFWNGPASTSIPLRFRLDDETDGPPVEMASDVVTDGTWETTTRLTTLGHRFFEVTVQLAAAANDQVLRSFTDDESFDLPVRERLELHARLAGDTAFTETIDPVGAGGAVTLRVRLAGDDAANVPITLSHDGGGSLPASATTNTQGEATVTYTAPSSAGATERVTATTTFQSLESSDSIDITTRDPVVVEVNPSSRAVGPGDTIQFSATVTGTTDQRVTWSANGGTISSTGLYTAGSTAGSFNVTATSVADPTKSAMASVQVTGRIVLERRLSMALAECSAQAHSEPTPVGRSGDDVQRSEDLTTATVSLTAGAGGTVSGQGDFAHNTASCSGSGSETDTVRVNGTSLTIEFTGSTAASGSASFSGESGTSSGSGRGNSGVIVAFRIEGSSVPFRAIGNFTSGFGGSGGAHFFGQAQLQRFLANGSAVDVFNHFRQGDHRTSPTVPEAFSRSGTLFPGRYELTVALNCGASGSDDAFFGSASPASCSSDGEFEFVIGTP